MAVESHTHPEGCGCLPVFFAVYVVCAIISLGDAVSRLKDRDAYIMRGGQALVERVARLEDRVNALVAREPQPARVEVEKK